MLKLLNPAAVAALSAFLVSVNAAPDASKCQKTDVVVLGAGLSGVIAAVSCALAIISIKLTFYQQTLSNNSINNFMVLDYNNYIGGRALHTTFGQSPSGKPYTVELGCNWVQGLGTPPGPENPIWTLAKKWHINNTYSNYSSILTYNETGYTDYSNLLDEFEDNYTTLSEDAGYILTDGLLDHSIRTGLTLSGWVPGTDAKRQAVEWWEWDWEYSYTPEETSQLFGITNYNTTFYQWSDANNYVWDQRGFNTFIAGEASTFLKRNDPRLQLSTVVTKVDYSSPDSVTVRTRNGTCITARYAICTFSLGVLQHAAAGTAPVSFTPAFPRWKASAIANFDMGIYTKVFLQFDPKDQFWDENTQYFLYADPSKRGWYPVWQSLSTPGFLPGSGIFFATVVNTQSRQIEAQSDEETLQQVMAVLRSMFGSKVPARPKAFMYPRWGKTEWSYGSYSNWPTGVTLLEHQNLRANLGRLWFAGEHTSADYYGFLQGAYYEGQAAGNAIAACLNGTKKGCAPESRYEVLRGGAALNASQFVVQNGWTTSSFLTYGYDD